METRLRDSTRLVGCSVLLLVTASVAHAETSTDTSTAIEYVTPSPSFVGETVTIDYVVWGSILGPVPTGDVTVTDGMNFCVGTVADGSCTITFADAGERELTAIYAGNSDFGASTSVTELHTVLELDEQADTTTTIIRDGSDPSVVGEKGALFFEATSRAGSPTGEVTISDGTESCTGVINEPFKDKCTIILTDPGTRELTATYAGNEYFNGSTSAPEPHTVERADTTTEIIRVGGEWKSKGEPR